MSTDTHLSILLYVILDISIVASPALHHGTADSTTPSTDSVTEILTSCDFDSSSCPWTIMRGPKYNLQWEKHKGPTSSSGTGPDRDHTNGNGSYIYMEASGQPAGEKAGLESPSFIGHGRPTEITFWYTMYGPYVSTLKVYVHEAPRDSTTPYIVWTKSGDQGPNWIKASAIFTANGNYTIILEATCGNSFRSDIAVDDITVFIVRHEISSSQIPISTSDILATTQHINALLTETDNTTDITTTALAETSTSTEAPTSTETSTSTEAPSSTEATLSTEISSLADRSTPTETSRSTETRSYEQLNVTIIQASSFIVGFPGSLQCNATLVSSSDTRGDLELKWIQDGSLIYNATRIHVLGSCYSPIPMTVTCISTLVYDHIYLFDKVLDRIWKYVGLVKSMDGETKPILQYTLPTRHNTIYGQELTKQVFYFIEDNGIISCSVWSPSGRSAATYHTLHVYSTPIVRISPLEAYMDPNSSLSLTCEVMNVADVHPELLSSSQIKWCSSEGLRINTVTSYGPNNETLKSTLRFDGILNETSFGCGIQNCTVSSTIHVVNPDKVYCPDDQEWKSAVAGSQQRHECPVGYSGNILRSCDTSGEWQTIQDNCVKNEIVQAEQVVSSIITTGKVDIHTLDRALDSINEVLNTTSLGKKRIQRNDVEKSIDIVQKIASAPIEFTSVVQAERTSEAFVQTASTLFSTTTITSSTETVNSSSSIRLVESLDRFGTTVTRSLPVNTSVSVSKTNVEILMARSPVVQIAFPIRSHPDSHTSVLTLPKESLQSLDLAEEMTYVATRYESLGSVFSTETGTESSKDTSAMVPVVNSDVLSLSLNASSHMLNPPLTLSLFHNQVNLSNPSCVFLYLKSGKWSTEGCKLSTTNSTLSVCQCSHLTNFAILMSPAGSDTTTADYERLRIISMVGCSVSVVCAFITMVIYIVFWRNVKSRRSALVVSLCLAIILAYTLFMTAVEQTANKAACIAIAAVLQYLFLSMFSIMLATAIDLAIAITQVFKQRRSYRNLLALSWGIPAIAVGITLGATKMEGFGDQYFCWLRSWTLYGFIGPAVTIILINLIILILAMRAMYSTKFMATKSKRAKFKSGIKSMSTLLPILGLTWVFGVLAFNNDLIVFQYLFALLNTLQGVFLFIFHCLLNKQIKTVFCQRIKLFERKSPSKSRSGVKFSSPEETTSSIASANLKKKFVSEAYSPKPSLPNLKSTS